MSHTTEQQARRPRLQRWVRRMVPVMVLLAGISVAVALVKSGPEAKREAPERQARLVEVQKVKFGKASTRIDAMGTVVPAQEVTLQPLVGGEVVAISDDLVPGGRFRTGDELLRIDTRDYQLAVLQRESDVAQAQSSLRLEQGQQSIAKREFELLNEPLAGDENDLVLRKPQLESVRAQLALAQAALDKARLDLQRTRVRAPFNAIVQKRMVDLGARVTTANTLVTLAGTDQCWVEVTVPVHQLKWISVDNSNGSSGARVRIHNPAAWGEGVSREGNVFRLAGDLEDEGRMARLLVAVDDPFALAADNQGQPVLLMDSYVRVEIEGQQLDQVASISRRHVRDGDQVWIMGEGGTLEIRKVAIAFRGRDQVLVTDGIEAGERLVVSDLAAPVAGMPIRLGNDTRAEADARP